MCQPTLLLCTYSGLSPNCSLNCSMVMSNSLCDTRYPRSCSMVMMVWNAIGDSKAKGDVQPFCSDISFEAALYANLPSTEGSPEAYCIH